MRRSLRQLIRCGGLALAMAGCGRHMDRAELVMINGAEPEVLDPPMMTAQSTIRLGEAVYEGLTALDREGKVGPGVAEKWEITPDGIHYTFHLRSNAVWSNGEPVTAGDFVYAWRRALDPLTASEYSEQLYYVKNGRDYNTGKITDATQVGVQAPDARTLTVELESPTAYFLDLCAFATLMPVHRATVEAHADWSSNPAHFMGNGPYLLNEWRIFDRVRLVKNPRYWNAATVRLGSVDVLPSTRSNTAFNLYATGYADLMMDKGLMPTELLTELRHRPDFHAAPFLGTYFVRFNVTRPAFKDPRVRQAFAMVLNKKQLVEKISRGGERPADTFVPPGTGGANYQPESGLTYDPEKARQLMAEAGYPKGLNFPRVEYLYKGDADLDRALGVEIQGMLKAELGVNMGLQAQEWTSYLDSLSRLDYDFARSSWIADYNDPNTFLNMFTTGGGNNTTGWGNPHYDELIFNAAREVDPGKRSAILHEAEKILVETEAPICPLFFYVGMQIYNPKLGGLESNLLDVHPLKALFWQTPR